MTVVSRAAITQLLQLVWGGTDWRLPSKSLQSLQFKIDTGQIKIPTKPIEIPTDQSKGSPSQVPRPTWEVSRGTRLGKPPLSLTLSSFGHCPFGGWGLNPCQDGLGEMCKYKRAFAWFCQKIGATECPFQWGGGGPMAIWAMPKWTAIFLWWCFP